MTRPLARLADTVSACALVAVTVSVVVVGWSCVRVRGYLGDCAVNWLRGTLV